MTNKEAATIVERIRYYMEGGECWTPTEFEAIDMAIEALTAQPDDDDTISRQAAIDAMENTDWYHINKDGQLTHGANSSEDEPLYKAEDVYKVLNDMPSVPPNLQPTCNNLATDAISRQAAIDALGGNEPVGDPSKMDDDDVIKMWERIRIINIINKLPSAQPEPQWIPCSKTIDIPDHEVLCCDRHGEELIGWLSYIDDQWLCESDGEMMYNPVAWRGKPEPYREEGEEDDSN